MLTIDRADRGHPREPLAERDAATRAPAAHAGPRGAPFPRWYETLDGLSPVMAKGTVSYLLREIPGKLIWILQNSMTTRRTDVGVIHGSQVR